MARILVTTDFSENSTVAIKHALEQTILNDSEDSVLIVLNVVEDFVSTNINFGYGFAKMDVEGAMDKAEKSATIWLREFCQEHFPDTTVQQVVVRARSGVADTIVEQAKLLNADLIVMGTHGRSGVQRMISGSVAEGVLRLATIPILLVPNKKP